MLSRFLETLNHCNTSFLKPSFNRHQYSTPTLDRCLYVYMHKFRIMGSRELSLLKTLIKPGAYLLDIGANIGLYTRQFSGFVGKDGRVTSFEPNPPLFDCLKQNTKDLDNVDVYNYAVSNSQGYASFYRCHYNSGDNRLVTDKHESPDLLKVQTKSLDSLNLEKLDFIKIDVQGFEIEVFEGAKQTFDNLADLDIYFEYWPYGLRKAGHEAKDLFVLLQDFGFRILYPSTEYREVSQDKISELNNRGRKFEMWNFIARKSSKQGNSPQGKKNPR